jgi:hypothetical protein
MANDKKPATSWRDALKIHPAAELFPRMTPDELKALGEDIMRNGLTSPIVLWRPDDKTPPVLLDGRNRLDAIEMAPGTPVEVRNVAVLDHTTDPYAYVVSANLHRRHLTTEQKRELIVTLIKANPKKSDRQIAETAKVGHPTVTRVRKKLEAKGDVERRSTSIDTKGRQQPARKGKPWSRERWVNKRAEAVERNRKLAELGAAANSAAARGDIGPTSVGELARLNACIGELQIENRRLANENTALRAELDKTKDELDWLIAATVDDDAPLPAAAGDTPDDLPLPPFPWMAASHG